MKNNRDELIEANALVENSNINKEVNEIDTDVLLSIKFFVKRRSLKVGSRMVIVSLSLGIAVLTILIRVLLPIIDLNRLLEFLSNLLSIVSLKWEDIVAIVKSWNI